MLSLIVPPIILILALAFLVYFFSKRLPMLQDRIDRGEIAVEELESGGVWRDRVKHAALSLLEKGIRRWKVGLLKAHNQAHTLTDSIRKRREASRERLLRSEESQSSHFEERERFFERVTKENALSTHDEPLAMTTEAVAPDSVPSEIAHRMEERGLHQAPPALRRPTRIQSNRMSGRIIRRPGQRSEALARSTAEEEPRSKEQLEALLIERIVTNPRDVEAYERLGDYYLEQESFADAKECYRQVLKLSPVNRLVKIKIRRLERVLESR